MERQKIVLLEFWLIWRYFSEQCRKGLPSTPQMNQNHIHIQLKCNGQVEHGTSTY